MRIDSINLTNNATIFLATEKTIAENFSFKDSIIINYLHIKIVN